MRQFLTYHSLLLILAMPVMLCCYPLVMWWLYARTLVRASCFVFCTRFSFSFLVSACVVVVCVGVGNGNGISVGVGVWCLVSNNSFSLFSNSNRVWHTKMAKNYTQSLLLSFIFTTVDFFFFRFSFLQIVFVFLLRDFFVRSILSFRVYCC